MSRWLRSHTVLGAFAALWVGLLLGARFNGWAAVQPAATVVLLVFGVITAIVILYQWGVTQDAVADGFAERARIAEEVDKILEEEEKSAALEVRPPPEDHTPK